MPQSEFILSPGGLVRQWVTYCSLQIQIVLKEGRGVAAAVRDPQATALSSSPWNSQDWFCLAAAEGEGCFLQVPVHFCNFFFCTSVFIYYACIKLLASSLSLVQGRRLFLWNINYLYRCGIEASLNYNLFLSSTAFSCNCVNISERSVEQNTESSQHLPLWSYSLASAECYSCHTTALCFVFKCFYWCKTETL